MKVPYVEGLASHVGPESCVHIREGAGEALTGVRAGRVLSREIHARDFGLGTIGVSRQCTYAEGNTWAAAIARQHGTLRGHRPRARTETSRTGTGRSRACCAASGDAWGSAHREAEGHTTMSHGRGKSDRPVVPKKLSNKAAGEAPAAAEKVEGRPRAKGNAVRARMSRRSTRVYDMGTALDGIRQTARGRRDAKFTGLLHHIYAVEASQVGLLRGSPRRGPRRRRTNLARLRHGAGSEPSGPVGPAGPRGLQAPACEEGVHRQGRRE